MPFLFPWQRARAFEVRRVHKATFYIAVVAVWGSVLCQAATLVQYPYLQNVSSDRATIMWSTRERGSGSVRYSPDFSFSRTAAASIREFLPSETDLSFSFYQYRAELTGLNPGTEYFYRVVVDGQDVTSGDELRFHTASLNPSFRFLVFGDSGTNSPGQRSLALRMLAENPAPDLVLHTGDVAYPNGTYNEFLENHFEIYKNLMKRVPFFPVLGNHEYFTPRAAPYVALHVLPDKDVPVAERGRYYSFDWGNVHFIALDSFQLIDAKSARMLEWLEKDLQKSPNFWRVAYFHHPPYTGGYHDDDMIVKLAETQFVPILERHEVPLVLNGHEHNYQRTYPLRGGTPTADGTGTVYIITGGGGATLYGFRPTSSPFLEVAQSVRHYIRAEVQGTRMTLRAIGLDGGEIDSVVLAPAPRISSNSTVDAASFSPFLAAGALVTIFGHYLSGTVTTVSEYPLPKEISGTTVTLNGVLLPLLYVSRNQINTQLPFDAQGTAVLRVTTQNGSTESLISLSEAAPAIFSVPSGFGVLPAIRHASGALVSSEAPAESGESISVYVTGLGQVNGQIEAGQPAPFFPLLQARLPVRVELGNTLITPSYAGLTPGYTGLYQVDVQLPLNLPSGPYTLRIVGGTSARSNAVELPLRATR